jgi:hypothetical protein
VPLPHVLYWYVIVTCIVDLAFLTLCQARWALSADEALQEVGSNTGIHYFRDFEEYLMILEMGLRQKKKSIINIIKEWDEKIFPNSDSSLVKGNFKKNDENSGVKTNICALVVVWSTRWRRQASGTIPLSCL